MGRVDEGRGTRKVEFTATPGEFADAFEATWRNLFPTCRLHRWLRAPVGFGKQPFWQMQIVSKQVVDFLRNLGLKGKSAERQIPPVILRSPKPLSLLSFALCLKVTGQWSDPVALCIGSPLPPAASG
jgi:hypothetical protein